MRHRCFAALIAALLFGQVLPAQREASPTPSAAARQAASLRAALRQALSPAGITVPDAPAPKAGTRTQELHFVWDPAPRTLGVAASAAGLRVTSRVRDASAFPRLRALDLPEDHLLLAAVDANGVLHGWSAIPDPRLVRIEVPGPDGVLTGQTLLLPRVEFLAPIPDDPAIVQVRLFQVLREGNTLRLELLATLVVPPVEGSRP